VTVGILTPPRVCVSIAKGSPAPRVGIIGGGLLGMTLALRLRQSGADVTLLEAASRGGGLAGAAPIGSHAWDRFYHVILLSDRHTRSLLEELGIADRLRWGITRTGFYTDGELHSLSTSVEFLRFPALSLIDKFRLGGTIFLASRLRDWRRLESVLAVDWLRRWSGPRVVERIWLPLLKSKLGDNYRIASASFIWAIIARMYAARRSGLKREMFGYVDGGYAVVLDALQGALEKAGVATVFGARVKQVEDQGGAVEVLLESGRLLDFDRVIATTPTGSIARMCPQLSEAEQSRLRDITYQGIVCPSLLLRKPLSPYYVTNITDRWVPFTGVIEMTALVDRERFGGLSLVYLPWYLTQGDQTWASSDAEIMERCMGALERMYPHFDRSDVVATQISRAREVLAISTLRYSTTLMPSLKTSLPNVFVLNSAQIAAGTLNVNETLGVVHDRMDELKVCLGLVPE
jgi:protoporphyrinogen oxidase